MNLQARLARIEKAIDPNVCPACGTDKSRIPQVSPDKAEAALSRYTPHVNRATARQMLAEDDPDCAQALGVNASYGPGYCQTCGADLRTSQQRAADAEAALQRYLPHVERRDRALELLAEDDPETARRLAV